MSAASRTRAALVYPLRAAEEPVAHRYVDGFGARLVRDDGVELIDATAQGTSVLLGHRHPALVAAIQAAAARPLIADPGGLADREQAAADLLEIAFADEQWVGAVRFCVSASEANDLALLLAQTLTERRPLVARSIGYYGAAGLSRDVTTYPLWHGGLAAVGSGIREPPPSGTEVRRLPAPIGEREERRALEAAPAALEGAAAVISDWGSGGVYPSSLYQDELAHAAAAAGALWIQDEVVTGMGRTGRWFAFQRGDERPDIVTLGKGLTGAAAPGGAIVLSQRVLDLMAGQRWQTVATFRGHALAVAAVRATLHVIAAEGLVERAAWLGRWFGEGLRELQSRHPCVERVDGAGLLWTILLRGPARFGAAAWRGDGNEVPPANAVSAAAVEHGVLISPYGGSDLYVGPPLTIEEDDLRQVLVALDAALAVADAAVA